MFVTILGLHQREGGGMNSDRMISGRWGEEL